MEKKKRRLLKNENGFTLIELIVIIAILGVISAIAVPNIMNATDDARKTTDITNARIIASTVTNIIATDDDINLPTVTAGNTVTYALDPGASASHDDFETAVINQLNGAVPVPQYHGTSIDDETMFIIVFDDELNMSVRVSDDATGSNTKTLFPTVDSDYN